MTRDELRTLQAPLKTLYQQNPGAAFYTLRAEGELSDNIQCRITSHKNHEYAGLHPATGGQSACSCSGNLLLESLVACAGVTLLAVATSAGFKIMGGKVKAEGDLDFRGTLGNKEVPAGFQKIRLIFELATDEDPERVAKLVELTERYCVVFQTLKNSTAVETAFRLAGK